MRTTMSVIMAIGFCGFIQIAESALAQGTRGSAGRGDIQTTYGVSLRGSRTDDVGLFIPPVRALTPRGAECSWNRKADANNLRLRSIPTGGLTIAPPAKKPSKSLAAKKIQNTSRKSSADATGSADRGRSMFPLEPWAIGLIAVSALSTALFFTLLVERWVRARRSRRSRTMAPAILAAGLIQTQLRGNGLDAETLTEEPTPTRRAA